ncbi:MAG: DUF3696 domain-containing protein [Pseudomonadota bacterium]
MITKWKVFNFKSVQRETELEFAPLTIFAGPNSSGKSTFLQSILLIAQTLLHRVSSRSVILNGTLARLGQFDDICSAGSEANQILIGFDCQVPEKEMNRGHIDEPRYREEPVFFSFYEGNLKWVSCELAFDADPSSPQRDVYQLQPRLFSCALTAKVQERDGDEESQSTISVVNAATSGETQASKMRQLSIPDPGSEAARSSLDWNISMDKQSMEEILERFRTADTVGCMLRHFLPAGLSLKVDRTVENSFLLASFLVGESLSVRRRRDPRSSDIVIPDSVTQLWRQAVEKAYIAADKKNVVVQNILPDIADGLTSTVGTWLDFIHSLAPRDRLIVRRALGDEPDLHEKIVKAFQQSFPAEFEIILHRLPDNLRAGIMYLERFFSTSIKYLGPLRDDPKAIYPLSEVYDPFDVGLRGERTAAVLDSHKTMQVRYIPSQCFLNPEVEIQSNMRTLDTAVADWLNYLGIAASVKTQDRGKLGHELKVNVSDEGRAHDLTHVGVGVSQVLPILVMSLLADYDTTLIFEQPELHLHPKVQTLLADFFISMISLGKQCIVETHSEYLINRLRFRVAASSGDASWADAMKVYFVEKGEEGSLFRNVRINEYGAILDWPDGFFDQSQREAEAILRAASIRRKTKREK